MLWHMPWKMRGKSSSSAIGRNQAVRIPREFELPGDEAILHKEGERLVLEPKPKKPSLLALLKTLEPIDEEFRRRRRKAASSRPDRPLARGLSSGHKYRFRPRPQSARQNRGQARKDRQRTDLHEHCRRRRASLWRDPSQFAAPDGATRNRPVRYRDSAARFSGRCQVWRASHASGRERANDRTQTICSSRLTPSRSTTRLSRTMSGNSRACPA